MAYGAFAAGARSAVSLDFPSSGPVSSLGGLPAACCSPLALNRLMAFLAQVRNTCCRGVALQRRVGVPAPCNDQPHTSWLMTETDSLTVLEAGSPKSRCHHSHTSSARSRGESVLSSGCWPHPLLGIWQHHASRYLCLLLAFSSLGVFSAFTRTLSLDVGPHPV